MEGCFTFHWGGGGGGVVFQMGGFTFKWGVNSMGGISFYGGGSLKKIVGCGQHAPHGPPHYGKPCFACAL